MKIEFSRHVLKKNPETSNFTKIRPVESVLFHEKRRIDMTKLKVAY